MKASLAWIIALALTIAAIWNQRPRTALFYQIGATTLLLASCACLLVWSRY